MDPSLCLVSIDEYKRVEHLGGGRFGEVWQCTKKSEPESVYAIRWINQYGGGGDRRIFAEVAIFQTIPYHPAICKFHGWSMKPPALVLEFLPNESLAELFDVVGQDRMVDAWTPLLKAKTIFGFAAAMMHLHANGGVHRYLTPKNIMFDNSWEPRLVDFGFARIQKEGTGGSLRNDSDIEYGAPECIESNNYDSTVDVFSFAMILWQILNDGKALWPTKPPAYKIQQDIKKGKRPGISKNTLPVFQEIMESGWARVPDDRPMFADIVKRLLDYDEPLFPGLDMTAYRAYQQRIMDATSITPEYKELFDTPVIKVEDQRKFTEAKALADKGNAEQQLRVGTMYERGVGVEKNSERAFEYYLRAASLNEPFAMFRTGICYLHGIGVPRNDGEAIRWFSRASNDVRLPLAAVFYGSLLKEGRGCVADPKTALTLFEQAANGGCPEAQYHYATMLLEEKPPDYEKVRRFYQLAAGQGIEGATIDLASMMAKGQGVPRDVDGALALLGTSAGKGSAMAFYNMGLIYDVATFGKKDPAQAEKMFKQAADRNLPEAMFKYGLGLARQAGTDPAKAALLQSGIHYIRGAADRGMLQAQVQFGKLHAEGTLIAQDIPLAKLYLESAAARGSNLAMVMLAEILIEGRGCTPRDVPHAKELLKAAVQIKGTETEKKMAERAGELLKKIP